MKTIEKPKIIEVFKAGAENIKGFENKDFFRYREQNVIVTNAGKVVCVCQGRNKLDWCDRSGQDLLVKISEDSGETWSEDHLVASHGLFSICPNASVYDAVKDKIHVLYNLNPWPFNDKPDWINGEVGIHGCQQYIVSSDDEGETWSEPRDISEMIASNGAAAIFGSGEGIQLKHGEHAGRLLIAGGDFYIDKKVLCFFSDDHGETWKRGTRVKTPKEVKIACETKVAELANGDLVMNSRTFCGGPNEQRLRTQSFSNDGGETWTELKNVSDLETANCNGSLIALDHEKGKDGVLLLCSVPIAENRSDGKVYISFDAGKTWPIGKTLVAKNFAYSSLILMPDGDIGLFYETENYQVIELMKFSLDWLLTC